MSFRARAAKGFRSAGLKRNLGVTWSIKEHKRSERDFSWVAKRSTSLSKKYSNRWIAVKNARVVAASPTLKGLDSQLKKHNISKDESLIQRIPPKDMKLVV